MFKGGDVTRWIDWTAPRPYQHSKGCSINATPFFPHTKGKETAFASMTDKGCVRLCKNCALYIECAQWLAGKGWQVSTMSLSAAVLSAKGIEPPRIGGPSQAGIWHHLKGMATAGLIVRVTEGASMSFRRAE